jgi:SAM-dependent methyltransferase
MSDDEAVRFLREHAHYRDDIAFWRRNAERLGSPVLDLGAAAGRVALCLARDGHEVWALDRSPEMLAQIARTVDAEPSLAGRIHPVVGDMRGFTLDRRFALVLIAMNTLQALTEPDDQLACLRAVREHLAPGGELIFDVALPDPAEIAETLGEERTAGEFVDPVSGATLAHSAWYDTWDPVTQTLEFTHRIRETGADGTSREFVRCHRVHLFMPVELDHLLARAGLETIDVLGDFGGAPVGPGAETQIRRCRSVPS